MIPYGMKSARSNLGGIISVGTNPVDMPLTKKMPTGFLPTGIVPTDFMPPGIIPVEFQQNVMSKHLFNMSSFLFNISRFRAGIFTKFKRQIGYKTRNISTKFYVIPNNFDWVMTPGTSNKISQIFIMAFSDQHRWKAGMIPVGMDSVGSNPGGRIPVGTIYVSLTPTDIIPTDFPSTEIIPTGFMPPGIIPTFGQCRPKRL